ncbi:hypothetical protein JADG_004302 [Aureobasidium aubasidani]|nr:hypothetical protein JADG_004302 [Aureobasidium pullulans]
MWYTMRRMWPTNTTGSNENIMMDRLRRFLDELYEDILEDRPENWYDPDGLIEYKSVPDEDEDEISDELEDGDLFEEHVDVSGQEEQKAVRSDQGKGTEDEEQILKDTKSQQSEDSEFDDSVTNLLFDLENESGELFTSSAINEGDSISPRFELQTFLETTEKVTADA